MGKGPGPILDTIRFSLFGSLTGLSDEERAAIATSTSQLLREAGVNGPITIDNFREGSIVYEASFPQGTHSVESLIEEVVDIIEEEKYTIGGLIPKAVQDEILEYDTDVIIANDTSFALLDLDAGKTTLSKTDWEDVEAGFTETTLTSVVILKDVETIDVSAFEDCAELLFIIIPNSVKSIGNYAFLFCSSLSSVTFGENSKLDTIGNSVFRGCSSLSSVVIPDQVTSIGNAAFQYCSSLSSVVIPNSVKSIGNWAFFKCSSLRSVTFGENSQLNSIGYQAFYVCSSLSSVIIPDSVTSIGGEAFYDCSSISSVMFGENSQLNSIGYQAFVYCVSLKEITIPGGVTEENFGDAAFKYCVRLGKVTFKPSTSLLVFDSNTQIQEDVDTDTPFYGSLIEYSFSTYANQTPEGVVSYEDGTPGQTTINRKDNVVVYAPVLDSGTQVTVTVTDNKNPIIVNNPVNLSWGAFSYLESRINKDNIKSWEVTKDGDYLTRIGDYAFYNCPSLSSVVIGNNVTSIGEGAFYYCYSLSSVTIPDSVTSIGNAAFYECISIKSVVIGNSVESIGNYAFDGCSSIKSVVIGNSVESIGDFAFTGCSNLSSVVIPDSVKNIGYGAFFLCTSLSSVTFGENSQLNSIGKSAFYACLSLKEITIPGGVTDGNFGDRAFKYCVSLGKVTFKPSSTPLVFDSTTQREEAGSGPINTPFYASLIEYSFTTYAGDFDGVTFSNGKTTINRTNEVIVTVPDVGSNTEVTVTVTDNKNPIIVNNPFTLSWGAFSYVDDKITKDNIKSWEVTKGGDYLTSIGDRAFQFCSSLSSVVIGNSVTSIGYRAFYSCTSLSSVVIPDSVTSIGREAFRGCSSLSSVVIGNSVESIGYRAFLRCSEIKIVTFKKTNGELALEFGNDAWEGVAPMNGITAEDVKLARINENAVYK